MRLKVYTARFIIEKKLDSQCIYFLEFDFLLPNVECRTKYHMKYSKTDFSYRMKLSPLVK